MECFAIAENVLDRLAKQITVKDESAFIELINQTLEQLSSYYLNLSRDRSATNPINIDYSLPEVRFAYVHSYTTCHADFIRQLLSTNREIFLPLISKGKFSATCVGGGPGSEILGILKYLLDLKNEGEKLPRLKFNLFDKEESWGDCWNNLDDEVYQFIPELQFFTNFQAVDVTSLNAWVNKTSFLESDLFTMSFFISEISKIREQATPFFEYLLSNARKDSIFLYIDNNNEEFFGWFDNLAQEFNLDVLKNSQQIMTVSTDEEKRSLGKYYEGVRSPKLTSDIAFRLCRKT